MLKTPVNTLCIKYNWLRNNVFLMKGNILWKKTLVS